MKAHIAAYLLAASILQAAEKPNIIVILTDDMGFSDLGCYGSSIDTPHLDSLAAKGLYPHQAGVGHI